MTITIKEPKKPSQDIVYLVINGKPWHTHTCKRTWFCGTCKEKKWGTLIPDKGRLINGKMFFCFNCALKLKIITKKDLERLKKKLSIYKTIARL